MRADECVLECAQTPRTEAHPAVQSLGSTMLKTMAGWEVERMGTCCETCLGDASIKAFVGSTGDTGDCDYCCSSRVSVADTTAVGQFIHAGVLRAYVSTENSGIPYDPEGGSYMSDFVHLEDVFAENDVFGELVVDAGGNERLF